MPLSFVFILSPRLSPLVADEFIIESPLLL